MIIEKIGSGKTVDEATAAAKALLNAPEDAVVSIEILEMGKKGFLFFKGTDARVKASYDDGKKEPKAQKKPAPKKEKKAKPAPKKDVQKKEAPKKEAPSKTEPKKTEPEKEQKKDYPKTVNLDYAKEYLTTILKGFNISDAKIEASYSEGVITLDLDCDDYGIVIGRRGETLDSIQYLLSLVMKKNASEYVRVVINVGNYREKRNETLRNLAKKNAGYVLRTGKRYTFEPMNPYERRIIHTAVQEIEGVESRSVGYNQDRRVVLEPTGGVKQRGNGGYRKGASKPKTAAPAENHTPKADRADLPKFGKIEVNKD